MHHVVPRVFAWGRAYLVSVLSSPKTSTVTSQSPPSSAEIKNA